MRREYKEYKCGTFFYLEEIGKFCSVVEFPDDLSIQLELYVPGWPYNQFSLERIHLNYKEFKDIIFSNRLSFPATINIGNVLVENFNLENAIDALLKETKNIDKGYFISGINMVIWLRSVDISKKDSQKKTDIYFLDRWDW